MVGKKRDLDEECEGEGEGEEGLPPRLVHAHLVDIPSPAERLLEVERVLKITVDTLSTLTSGGQGKRKGS